MLPIREKGSMRDKTMKFLLMDVNLAPNFCGRNAPGPLNYTRVLVCSKHSSVSQDE